MIEVRLGVGGIPERVTYTYVGPGVRVGVCTRIYRGAGRDLYAEINRVLNACVRQLKARGRWADPARPAAAAPCDHAGRAAADCPPCLRRRIAALERELTAARRAKAARRARPPRPVPGRRPPRPDGPAGVV